MFAGWGVFFTGQPGWTGEEGMGAETGEAI